MRRRAVFAGLALALAIGAWLRLALVNAHGLDGDESFSIALAQGPPNRLIHTFASDDLDLHPKLYYLILGGWIRLTGTAQAGLRLLNILFDLLLAAALIRTARRLFGPRAALSAAALWSVNPLLIWVTGQVRMYALLALLATLAWLWLLRALSTPRPVWWIAFGLAALGVAYTQIMGAVVLAGAGVVVGLWAMWRRRWGGVVTLSAVGAAYLPYALVMWERRANHPPVAESPPESALDFVQKFVTGLIAHQPDLPGGLRWALVGTSLGLLAWAWIAAQPRALARTALLLVGGASLGMAYFAFAGEVFRTKYFAYIIPLFLLGLALGIEALPGRWLRGGALLALALAALIGLADQLSPLARDNFPAAARYIERHGDAGDLVIVTSSYGEPPFRAYYRGESRVIAPWYGISPDMPLDDLLTFVTQGHDTAWLVLYLSNAVDPAGLLDGWFRARYPLRAEVFPAGLVVRAYDLRPTTGDLPPEAIPLDVVFGSPGEGVRLRGFQVYTGQVARRDYALHPPSGWVHITLYWETLQPGTAFEPVVRLENEWGALYGGTLTRASDVLTLHPPITWKPGQVWRSDVDLNLNPAAPPGSYKIVVRVTGPDGAFWPVAGAGADWLILGRVRVTR